MNTRLYSNLQCTRIGASRWRGLCARTARRKCNIIWVSVSPVGSCGQPLSGHVEKWRWATVRLAITFCYFQDINIYVFDSVYNFHQIEMLFEINTNTLLISIIRMVCSSSWLSETSFTSRSQNLTDCPIVLGQYCSHFLCHQINMLTYTVYLTIGLAKILVGGKRLMGSVSWRVRGPENFRKFSKDFLRQLRKCLF